MENKKINNEKSSHVTFTLDNNTIPPVFSNNKII